MKLYLTPKTSILAVCVLVWMAATLGCVKSYNTRVNYDQEVEFSTMKTFAWLKPEAGVENPMELDKFTAIKVKKAIKEDLEGKGFNYSENNPDFLIVFYGSSEDKLTVIHWSDPYPAWGYRGWHSGWGHHGDIYVEKYKEGTLVIDVIASANQELIWRGSITGPVEERAGKLEKKLTKAVNIILLTFPPT